MGISEQAYKSMEAIINSKIGLPKKWLLFYKQV
jgi:hypothetical protein